jgi:hypothetical protein
MMQKTPQISTFFQEKAQAFFLKKKLLKKIVKNA